MIEPVDALRDYGPVYKGSSASTRPKVHLSETCSRSPDHTTKVEHPGGLPLRSEVCRECDPTVTIDTGRIE
jgi:hypothetical protein